jgi:hypothetical protein
MPRRNKKVSRASAHPTRHGGVQARGMELRDFFLSRFVWAGGRAAIALDCRSSVLDIVGSSPTLPTSFTVFQKSKLARQDFDMNNQNSWAEDERLSLEKITFRSSTLA